MKIPIEKHRLFKILEELVRRHGILAGRTTYTYAYVFKNDEEAVEVLADMGFIEWEDRNLLYGNSRVYLKNEFITHVGLALFREHEKEES